MRQLSFRTLLAGLLAWSLTIAPPVAAQDRPLVVAVNHPLQYLAERVLGAGAKVVFPVPAGVDPSFWRPRISDISTIQSADLVLLNGAAFATWVDRVSLRRSKVVTTSASFADRYIATETITHSHGDGGEHSHEGIASYLWLDPALAALQAEAIAGAAVARGLATEAEVAPRLDALKADLAALDAEARDLLSSAPDVPIVATHPRYHYFARAYGVTIQSLEWEAGAAPSPEDLADLQALSGGAGVLLWEAAPPPSALEATKALGLVNVVFPPLAQPAGDGDFIASLRGGILALSQALATQ